MAAGVIALASCSNTSSWWNDGEYEYTTEVNDSMFDGLKDAADDFELPMPGFWQRIPARPRVFITNGCRRLIR